MMFLRLKLLKEVLLMSKKIALSDTTKSVDTEEYRALILISIF